MEQPVEKEMDEEAACESGSKALNDLMAVYQLECGSYFLFIDDRIFLLKDPQV